MKQKINIISFSSSFFLCLKNVLDNNLSKSKKEAVLLRRLTDRRRKPSKKFRHNQNSRSIDSSSNQFIDEFLDQTSSRLKKSNSMNLLDFEERKIINKPVEETNKSANINSNRVQDVKLRHTESAVNRGRVSTPNSNEKTYSGWFIILFKFI